VRAKPRSLDHGEQLLATLTTARDAIKVHCELASGRTFEQTVLLAKVSAQDPAPSDVPESLVKAILTARPNATSPSPRLAPPHAGVRCLDSYL